MSARALKLLVIPMTLPLLADAPLTGAAAYGDWHSDAPGVVRHFTPDAMPKPYTSSSALRAPSVVPRPAGATLHVPPGFDVEQFATGLAGPRTLRVAANGDVFVAESRAGRVRILRVPPGAAVRPQSYVFADGLSNPFGIAFWPPGPNPRFVYVAETNQVVRFPYQPGQLRARDKPEIVVSHLPTGGHWTRDLVFSPDGHSMFVSVGSATNAGTDMPARDAASARSLELGRMASAPPGATNRIAPTCWCSIPTAAIGASMRPGCATARPRPSRPRRARCGAW